MLFSSSVGMTSGSYRAMITVCLLLGWLTGLWFATASAALAASTPWDIDEGPGSDSFFVNGIRFRGNTVFPTAEFEARFASKVGRAMSLAELEEMAREITHIYRDLGYPLATAYVPPQEIVDGVVEIAIVEGRWGRIILENHSGLKDVTVMAPRVT